MRKEITIVGIGNRREGISEKTGRKYGFTPISFTYEDVYTDGVSAQTVNVDDTAMPVVPLFVGEVREAVLHTQNYRMFVDAIL